jgi:RimJ/RimL family protein N-acetyltransferase
LYVAELNQRAINVYERVGFRAAGSSVRETPQGTVRLLSMELDVPGSRERA